MENQVQLAKNSIGDTGGVWAGNRRNGYSIAQKSQKSQKSQRAQRGLGGGGRRFRGEHSGVTCENYAKGKASHGGHGGRGGGLGAGGRQKWLRGEHRWLSARTRRKEVKHRTEVAEVAEGDWEPVDDGSAVELWLPRARTTRNRKASHGGRGGRGGGLGAGGRELTQRKAPAQLRVE